MNTYRAQCGRRREFLSHNDADNYDLGWSEYPRTDYFKPGPYADGWYDREQDQQDRDDAKMERYLRETEE